LGSKFSAFLLDFLLGFELFANATKFQVQKVENF